MRTRPQQRTSGARRGRTRRGVALIMVLLMVTALGGLATASIFLMSNSELFTRAAAKESMLRNAADAGLEMARSRMDKRGSNVPPTLDTLYWKTSILDAAGNPVPGVKVNVYAGQTGSASGQFGTFLSLVAEAVDERGNKFVRRQELAQESFAKFAYWTDIEKSTSGGTIYFAAGDQIRGPLWTNDIISIASPSSSSIPKAKFWDEVRTAKTISPKPPGNGEFVKGFKENQPVMALPPNTALARLASYANEAGYSFTAPNSGNESGVLMRIEFVAANMNPLPAADGDADSLDLNEGFFRVFVGATGRTIYLRPDLPSSVSSATVENCGDWHADTIGGKLKFYPASVHNTQWFRRAMQTAGMSSSAADTEAKLTIEKIAAKPNARCFPAGSPYLAPVERQTVAVAGANGYDTLAIYRGGEDTTFTPVGKNGQWLAWPKPGDPTHPLLAAHREKHGDARYLHPLHRSMNGGVKGVIHVKGTVAVSGVLRGRATLYAEGGTIVIIDDLRYAHDPGSGSVATGACQDMLGMIASNDIVVADNVINKPQYVGSSYKFFDDTKDLYIHGTVMALNESFRVQNYSSAPRDATTCEGKKVGRGCLYLTGGIIQVRRGIVGQTSGEGYIKRYSYDRCAADAPPPYFPVTGRYIENAYLELDPTGFNVVKLFKELSPTK